MRILVTGGCGFIGSAVIRNLIRQTGHEVINLDKQTYAASTEALEEAWGHPRHTLIIGDIADADLVNRIFAEHRPQAVMHLAAETHVDRSIDGPAVFIQTNLVGTYVLLDAARRYWAELEDGEKAAFRFHHISTDEVFGSLEADDPAFTETTPYDPRSPYSASKAGSDHLVRAWHHTYGLPTLVSNTCNNYGPWQFPEKLIPLITLNALECRELPVYGDGTNVRDWLHVDDHAAALVRVVEQGEPGATYAIGARQAKSNLHVVRTICAVLDELAPADIKRETMIRFVADRPGHDFRYEIDPSHAESALGWAAEHKFEGGLRKTIEWYLAHRSWWEDLRAKRYAGQRLGLQPTKKGEAA